MLTQPQTISDSSDAASSAKTPFLLAGNFIQQLRPALKALWGQRVWLLFLIPFAFACWKPLQNSFRNWGNPDNVLLYQPLVPFAAALLVWQERAYLQSLWQRLQAYPTTDKRRKGSLIPVVLGCLFVLFGHLVYVDSLFGIGLLLILVGTIYYIYGGLMVRTLVGPLALLILMINPPDSLLSITNKFAKTSTAFAVSSVLSLLGKATSVNVIQGSILIPIHTFDAQHKPILLSHPITITDPINGANILLAMLFITFICAWYQRRTPLYTFCFLVMVSVFVLFVHLIRVTLYSLTEMGSPKIANLLLTFNPWFIILILTAMSIYATQSLDLFSLRFRVAAKRREKYGTQKKGLGKRLEQKMMDPLFNASDKGVTALVNQHKKLSKSTSTFFKKLLPGKKRNDRKPW